MADVALFMTVRAKPGQRDALRAVWERHLKPRAAANPKQAGYYYCYAREHPDEIRICEYYTDETALEDNAISAFFQDFMAEAAPLMEGEPDVSMADPVWIKERDS